MLFVLLSANKHQHVRRSAQGHTVVFRCSAVRDTKFVQLGRIFLDVVVPAWIAGTQVDMHVAGRVPADLDAGSPCRHDGFDAIIVS